MRPHTIHFSGLADEDKPSWLISQNLNFLIPIPYTKTKIVRSQGRNAQPEVCDKYPIEIYLIKPE